MVAEEADDSEEIVAESEEQPGRGETSSMKEEEKIVAEEQEEQEEQMTAESEVEAQGEAEEQVAVAENEEVSESSDEVAVESTSEAMAEESVEEEQAEANAEVIEHSMDTHECIDNSGWYGDKPVHVIEYHERILETLEDAGSLIAELDRQITELTEIKGKYDAMIAEAQEKALSEKRACAKVFAEKQGLDVNDTAVAEAIENLDYAKIAELTMAEEQEPEEVIPEKQEVTLASFVEMEVGNDKYGGLLNRKNK